MKCRTKAMADAGAHKVGFHGKYYSASSMLDKDRQTGVKVLHRPIVKQVQCCNTAASCKKLRMTSQCPSKGSCSSCNVRNCSPVANNLALKMTTQKICCYISSAHGIAGAKICM